MKKIKESTIFPHDRSELTLEKLRKYPEFEDVQEGEAEEHIKLIKTMARILFSMYQEDQRKESIKP